MADTPILSIHQAAKDGNIGILKKASKKDLNRGDMDGWTAVHWVAWNGNTEAVKTVISKGGDIERTDEKGSTPLHVAATYGHLQALEVMIKHGANLWALDNNGRTAAKMAAFFQKAESCRYLDTLAVRWEMQNREYVERMQLKAMKDLKKRVKKASEEKKDGLPKKLTYEYSTAPSGLGATIGEDERPKSTSSLSLGEGKKKKKMTPQEALRQNFELRATQSSEHIERNTGEDESDAAFQSQSAGNTFHPTPRVNAGPLINTLQSLAQQPLRIEPPGDQRHRSLESGFVSSSSSETRLSQHASGVTTRASSKGGVLEELVLVPPQQFEAENNSPLATFLQAHDLTDCVQLLHKEKLDLEALALCNEKDLISIGLPLGPRKKILHALERRSEIMAKPGKMTDTDL